MSGIGPKLTCLFAVLFLASCSGAERDPLTGAGKQVVSVMDFSKPFSLDPLPAGWSHRTFWTAPAMELSLTVKDDVPALRCETNGGGSIFGRDTELPLADYPFLVWDWLIEVPIDSAVDERTRDGDDHPARLYVKFRDTEGADHAIEIIWSNEMFAPGEYKVIGDFYHYVANGLDANVGTWHRESVDLLGIYRKATGRQDAGMVTQIAIFCDSDNTGTRSLAYFGKVHVEKAKQ